MKAVKLKLIAITLVFMATNALAQNYFSETGTSSSNTDLVYTGTAQVGIGTSLYSNPPTVKLQVQNGTYFNPFATGTPIQQHGVAAAEIGIISTAKGGTNNNAGIIGFSDDDNFNNMGVIGLSTGNASSDAAENRGVLGAAVGRASGTNECLNIGVVGEAMGVGAINFGLQGEASGDSSAFNLGVNGYAGGTNCDLNIGVGGIAEFGTSNVGVQGEANGDSCETNTGVVGTASGSVSDLNIGVKGGASNGDNNIGVFGSVDGEGGGVTGSAMISSGTVSIASGVDAVVQVVSGATITNAYAMKSSWDNQGTITNGTGLLIGDVNATNQVAIHQDGADDVNIFDGRFQCDILPSVDNTYTLGNSTYGWKEVWADNGTIQTSDIRMKKDIQDLNYGLNEILELKPISYTWKSDPEYGTKIGFSAQQVQKVIKEAVVEGNTGEKLLGINYGELVPVLVKAIQDQQAIINEQAVKTERLEKMITMCCESRTSGGSQTDFDNSSISAGNAWLEQNIPNPFSKETEIRFYLPDDVSNAAMLIYDLQGTMIKNVKITDRNYGKVTIGARELVPGVYFYSLIIGSTTVDTKTMIVTH
ncbi:MAG: hypothetical protein KatS3mg031_2340 [Chitinophagales bacterium]|nr:MAG: hypothetical protein KatS3mg031_2340 [Chitinophagales bacterium]